MPTSNKAVEKAVATFQKYFSRYTGDEVEAAIKAANEIMPFLDQNIVVPPAVLTGDFQRAVITTLTKDMWLDSVMIYCNKPFSASVREIEYSIVADNETLVKIPNELMTDADVALTFHVGKTFHVGTELAMVSSSTKAYGEVFVKLNFA